MSRTHPSRPLRPMRGVVLGSAVVLAAASCGPDDRMPDPPLAVEAPSSSPADLVTAPDPPPEPAPTLDRRVVEPDDVPDWIAPAVSAVFARPVGAVSSHSWIHIDTVRVDLFMELTWETTTGSVRRWTESSGEGLDTSEGQEVATGFDDSWSREETLTGESLDRERADVASAMSGLFGSVPLIERADDWWRGLGLNGFLSVGVRIVDGMVDEIDYGVPGMVAEMWTVER